MNNLNHQLEPHQNATSAFDSADDSVRTAEYVFGKADAKRSATLVQVIALAGMVACVAGAALLQAPINQQRKELQLVLSNDLYKELPPKYAWVSAAGGTFRGIAADVLWMRAEGLKQEGKYYELHQLAKWICTLQPRFPAVWVFQSWNMAYNISVGTHTVQERWQWVYNGIRLLRDEGIPNNDKTATLYYQLAWTFYHKVGAIMDDYQLYYKRIWATTMEVLLGSPSAGLSDEEQIDYYKPIAYAPRRLEELIAQHPGVAKLAEQLKSLGINVNDSSTSINNIFHPWEEQFFKPYTRWLQQQQYVALLKKPPTLDDHTQRFYEFLDNASPADLAALIAYMRATVLREQYKMDPMFMYELPRNLSKENPVPIDWRTPWAHSLYWGTYGATKGRQVNNAQTFDLLNNDRVALFSIGQMIRLGRYIFRPNLDQPEQSYLSMGPDFRYIELVHRRSLEIGQRYLDADEHGIQDTAGRTFKDFHINTLETSLVSLYLAGYEKEALKYFEYLVTYYTDPYTGEIRNPYLHKTFQEFMQANIVEVRSNQYDVILLLNSLLNRAYLALGNGQVDEYVKQLGLASQLYQSYNKDKLDDQQGRRTLAPWDQLRADALANFVCNPSPSFPLALRFAVWNRIDATGANIIEVKQRCYDNIRVTLGQMYGTILDLDKAFPAPPGMDAWRESHPIERPEQVTEQERERKKQEEAQKAKP